jgi:hypothetical protein
MIRAVAARRGGGLVALVAACALFAGACEGSGGTTYACDCDYVTDTDVPGEQSVTVCVPEGARADQLGAGCVRDLGVGRAEKCECKMLGEPCRLGLCLQQHR